jgi:hypothetical protein
MYYKSDLKRKEKTNEEKHDELLNAMGYLIDNISLEERKKVFEGLAHLYMSLPDIDDEFTPKEAVGHFVGHFCHECAEPIHIDVDEKYDEEYHICNGGSSLVFKDKAKGIGNNIDEFRGNLEWSKPNNCSNRGDETEGIGYFIDKIERINRALKIEASKK